MMTGTMHSIAMVDRSGWDQSFIDIGVPSQLLTQTSSTASTSSNAVFGVRTNVAGGSTRVISDDDNVIVDGISSRREIGHRLHDFVFGLRISDFRNDPGRCRTMFRSNSVDRDDDVAAAAASSRLTNTASEFCLTQCVLPVRNDRLRATPTDGECSLSSEGSVSCSVSVQLPQEMDRLGLGQIDQHATSVVKHADRNSCPSTAAKTKDDSFNDAFPTYENTTWMLASNDCQQAKSARLLPTSSETPPPPPFDLNSAQSFTWMMNAVGIVRHSSSASDFVGSSAAGSPPPFATPSTSGGGVDLCCRSSSSPFRIGSGSQSDSGCSDGGCDSNEQVPSLQTTHFRFPGGPSPVIDECTPGSSFAANRSRSGELVHTTSVRFPPGSISPMPTSSGSLTAPPAVVVPSAYSQVVGFLPAWDVERLEMVYSRLRTCGFYYGRMPIDEATERLKQSPVGTFLLRDSSDERYLFSISVQTCRGTTSIRVAFRSGLFRLDCCADQEHLMPTFDCVLRLIAYYVGLCRRSSISNGSKNPSTVTAAAASQPTGSSYVLLEASGRRDTPVLLRAPLRNYVPPLGHLCRRTIHGALGRGGASQSWLTSSEVERSALVDRLHLIPSLKRYLKDYPYDL